MSETHASWGPLLSAYLDGELDPARRQRVSDHLAGCAVCRADLAGLRAGATLLAGLAPPPYPPRLNDQVRGGARRAGARLALTALLVVLPLASTRSLVGRLAVLTRADLPLWFRLMRAAGYGLLLPPLTLLELALVRHVRDLTEYGWLSGQQVEGGDEQ